MKDVLEGDIAYMSVPDLLQYIDLKRKSCTVSIINEGVGTSLYLDRGKIFFASSEKKGLRFGEFLVRSGLLSESQSATALEESRKAGKRFTEYLIESGAVSCRLLHAAFFELADLILMEVFKYRSGFFSVTDPVPDAVVEGPIRLQADLDVASIQRLEQRERERHERRKSLEKIKERIRKGDFHLPALPDMIMHLLAVVEDEKSTFNDMVRTIMTDQVLVSRVLKVANSPLYAAGERIDSIHLALARMGMRSILNIAIAFKMNALSVPGAPQAKLQGVLDDAIKTAFVASGLARGARLDPEEAFLGGLMHDLGKTVIFSLAPAALIDDPVFEELVAEMHGEIGALIARKWHYPDSIGDVILHHHDCRYAGKIDRVVGVVQLADLLVQHGVEEKECQELSAELSLWPEDVREVYQQAMESFRQTKGF
ncbi:HDOD domain-containing protein [Geomonas sp. RF6]|uniref:HDOD domain-containing protein n=1 Tax=Geomonas sp. RF6 TaxID=2897342 RepID=UPI001E6143CC|nr:HDOD domain-containing protein [Geomonas sp. RF6]UFS72377.1 HDOD domain-containing protein [Geomonas sp. RF6]